MLVIDSISQILKKEGVEYLSAFPTTSVIEAAAGSGIKPIICRQERVGVGIADGYSRITTGNPPGVFAMQYGPGAEKACLGGGIAIAGPNLFSIPCERSDDSGRELQAAHSLVLNIGDE